MKEKILVACGILFICAAAEALDLGDVAKFLGAEYAGKVVTREILAKPTDAAINSMLFDMRMKSALATKVVPVIIPGVHFHDMMAQVCGLPELVDSVKAVLLREYVMNSGRIKGQVLIPVDTATHGARTARVEGVGVSSLFNARFR